jgi:hypothetical protein
VTKPITCGSSGQIDDQRVAFFVTLAWARRSRCQPVVVEDGEPLYTPSFHVRMARLWRSAVEDLADAPPSLAVVVDRLRSRRSPTRRPHHAEVAQEVARVADVGGDHVLTSSRRTPAS